MTTAYVTHMRYLEHTLDEHPENAERLRAIWRRLEDAGVLGDLTALEPAPATQSQMEAIHQRRYLEMLASTRTATVMLDPDTYALPVSYEVACLSAGGVVRAVDAVLRSEADNALALTRPPGHHARPGRGMGFCLLNNVAIAARYAQSAFGLERILIADYDVHHGNGTQEVFYADPEVLYISTHQYPFYPGTGALGDTGIGAGQGTTINLPLRTGVGDEGYARLYAEVVWPAARRFSPQLIIVSAGFDAHWAEPLAGMNLSLAGYAHLTSALVAMANELCGGRIVFALEGGYNHDVLGNATLNACHALLGRDQVIDPLGRAGREEPSVERLLEEAKRIHRLR
jgi:acetoin utilization deacetylase AcuC-like enzyme